MSKVRMITMADMHREPTPPWVADDLRDEIKRLRCEVVRLKRKAGEEITLADIGLGPIPLTPFAPHLVAGLRQGLASHMQTDRRRMLNRPAMSHSRRCSNYFRIFRKQPFARTCRSLPIGGPLARELFLRPSSRSYFQAPTSSGQGVKGIGSIGFGE